jgi:hypothetical protein
MPGGICTEYLAGDDTRKKDIKARIRQITDIINSQPNLIFAQAILEGKVR